MNSHGTELRVKYQSVDKPSTSINKYGNKIKTNRSKNVSHLGSRQNSSERIILNNNKSEDSNRNVPSKVLNSLGAKPHYEKHNVEASSEMRELKKGLEKA